MFFVQLYRIVYFLAKKGDNRFCSVYNTHIFTQRGAVLYSGGAFMLKTNVRRGQTFSRCAEHRQCIVWRKRGETKC